VLSIGKMVAGAEEYYLCTVAQGREEYYTGSGESPGTWIGSGPEALGLSGEVAPDDLRRLLAGISPHDDMPLGTRRTSASGRVAGFDLTFSPPKSVSLLYGIGSPDQATAVRIAHDQAVTQALTYFERHAALARRGAGGATQIQTSGLVAAAFLHRTSRAGDPQLHTHVLAANAVLGTDGRWSAPDARLLYFHARTAGFVYQASLRAALVESLGVRFGPVTRGAAELAGVAPGLLRGFSTRRAEIEEYLERRGDTSRRTAELAALATRSAKSSGRDQDGNVLDQRSRWREQAIELGFDPALGLFELGAPQPVSLTSSLADSLTTTLIAPDGLTAQESAFERRDVVRAIADRLPNGGSLDDIEQLADRVLDHAGVVALAVNGRGGELFRTTTELLDVETRLLEVAADLRSRGVGLVDPAIIEHEIGRHRALSGEQATMVRSLATSGAGIDVVVGKAGAGKTTALRVARQVFEGAGFRVSGTALAARAAEELEVSAGIRSSTLARFLGEVEVGSRTLGPSDIIVVDEAGMVGTRVVGQLVELAAHSGAKLILVGDPRQLSEIEAGGAFGSLARSLGATELTENRRQHELWERFALDDLRSGDVAAALGAYGVHDRIRASTTMAEAQADMVQRWSGTRSSGSPALMVAVNRSDVDALNRLARRELRGRGALGPDVLLADISDQDTSGTMGRSFAIGDAVVCLRNARFLGVLNGTRGTVLGVDQGGLTLATELGPRVLPERYVRAGHLDYGYATTVHKAQGATYARAFVLATDALTREAGYVAMSRARAGTELFVVSGAIEQGLGPAGDEAEPLARVAARLATSRAKHLATDYLEARELPRRDYNLFVPSGSTIGRETEERRVLPAGTIGGLGDRTAGDIARGSQLDLRTDFSGPEPPSHITNALGRRPAFVDEQECYDAVAMAIDDYRSRYCVAGDDALGTRPFESAARLAYDAVAEQIARFEHRLGRELAPRSPDIGLGL
jgi:conjugative relaxase-like TrwC/TraI family protein